MYYEINVADSRGHLFATAERSIRSDSHLKQVYDLFIVKFPKEDGYKLTVTKWHESGSSVEGYPS